MFDPTGPIFKYVSAGLGILSLGMGVALWFLWGAYNDSQVALGESKQIAQRNFDAFERYKVAYENCDGKLVSVIEENNAFIRGLAEADDERRDQMSDMRAENRAANRRIEGGLAELGDTPVAETCPARLENVEGQLDGYREIVTDE